MGRMQALAIYAIALFSFVGLVFHGIGLATVLSYRAQASSIQKEAGPIGPQGISGEDGKDATQKQVDNAVAKYLEANPPEPGKDGEKGNTGLTGKPGATGKTGKTGKRGPQGSTPSSAQVQKALLRHLLKCKRLSTIGFRVTHWVFRVQIAVLRPVQQSSASVLR